LSAIKELELNKLLHEFLIDRATADARPIYSDNFKIVVNFCNIVSGRLTTIRLVRSTD